MLNSTEFKVLKNYYLQEFINSINYILTFDPSIENKYIINIVNSIIKDNTSNFIISIIQNKNNNNFMKFEKSINAILPTTVVEDIIDEIRRHFADTHYISYSSINNAQMIQTLQNEKFSLNIKLNNDEEVTNAEYFNYRINSNDRHPTKALKLI